MNSRERMTNALRGEKVDRRAWAPEINDFFMRDTLKKHSIELGSGAENYAQCCNLIGGDTLWNVDVVEVKYKNVGIEVEESGNEIKTRYETEKGVLTTIDIVDHTALTTYQTKHLLEQKCDFEPFKNLVENMEFVFKPEEANKAAKELGDLGVFSLNSAVTPLMDLIMFNSGLERTIVLLYEYPSQLREVLEVMHIRHKERYELVCQADGYVVRSFEDTSSTLTSPSQYGELCVSHLNDYAEIVHNAGKKYIVHMCGTLKHMLGVLKGCDIDGIEAITPSPTGDVRLSEVRNALGDDLILIGGIDPTLFSYESRQSIESMLDELFDEIAGDPRIIVGSEEISAIANLENVMLVSEKLNGVGL